MKVAVIHIISVIASMIDSDSTLAPQALLFFAITMKNKFRKLNFRQIKSGDIIATIVLTS